MTPWSTHVSLVADVDDQNGGDDLVRLSVMFSTDPGPARAFRQLLAVDLDEAHATELLGTLSIALQQLRQAREAAE